MLRKLLFFVALILATSALLQAQTGSLVGKITDKATKEAIPFVNLIVEMGGKQMGGATTDFDGNFIIKPLNPGRYNLKATYVGYKPIMITDIVVSPDKITKQDIPMESSATTLNLDVEVIAYKVPLVEADQTSSGQTLTSDEITKMPGRDATSVAILTGGVFSQDGSMGSVRGQRDDATNIYIDGIRVRGNAKVPQQSIDQVSMVTGGIPAQYGDATGGIMSVTTKGAAANFSGGGEILTSQFTDKFGYNLISFSLQGPLLRDSAKNFAKLGFFLAGEFGTTMDNRPAHGGYYRVKADKLADIEKNPLIFKSFSATSKADYLRKSDLEKIDASMASRRYTGSIAAKFDFRLSRTMNLMFGGSGDFDMGREFIFENSLMNWENNPYSQTINGRVFARFSQRFNSSPDSKSLFKNIFYSVQADYSKIFYKYQDYRNKDNFMAYGYLGKYKLKRTRVYESFAGYGPDSVFYTHYYIFRDIGDTLVSFERSNLNPVYANYAEQFFNQYDPLSPIYRNYSTIGLAGGIFNGQLPNSSGQSHEGCWSLPGTPTNYYQENNNTTFGINAMFSADIKKHNIQIGFQIEQRTDRGFTITPLGLWNLARIITNSHISQLDLGNYILSTNKDIDGDGVNDTVFDFNFKYNKEFQPRFDKQLRKSLGLAVDGFDKINIDELEPSQINISMFSADELLNNGRSYIRYYGYSYDGKVQKSKPTFDDFFTKKDADGYKTRPIAPFQPNYSAFYIQDKFYFDDLIFNLGVRVDRFDANQMVLKDPYLLYEAYNVGELTELNGVKIDHPSNIKDDYIPYVNSIENPTEIVAYRYKDKFYTKTGSEITDYSIIRQMDLQGKFIPYLKNKNQFEVNSGAFKDYKPQVVVMPRIAFSFPISDEANFMANYNVLTKRPSQGWRMDPSDYYFLVTGNTQINNPELKPEKTITYEIGFQQKLTKKSALKLNTYYSEIRDQIQRFYYAGAYPRSYIGFNNVDFGTVKGFILAYDLRRSGNVRVITNYTLSFAEGTGSSAESALGLIRSGQANMRSTSYLDYDRRHSFNLNIDFRYDGGKDYNGYVTKMANGKVIRWFENMGINTTFMAGSGVPYTKSERIYSTITGWGFSQIAGGINNARQPWEINVNTKIDRDIYLGAKKNIFLNVYAEIFNVLNRKNIIRVYRGTGLPNDDGVLAAAEFDPYIAATIDPISFRELYSIRMDNLYNYSMPRRIRLGVSLNF